MILPDDVAKTVLITGSTDGIGLKTAEMLAKVGHNVILHGRNPEKLDEVKTAMSALDGVGQISGCVADLSRYDDVIAMADQVIAQVGNLDGVINNAGVLKLAQPRLPSGLDARFVVNTFAPYLLTRHLLPILGPRARVINVSSAAQSPVDPEAMAGRATLADMAAYSQSKLALTMWSRHLAEELGSDGPVVISVNPGSLLGSKMVKEGFGIKGGDLSIGADILSRLTVSDEFADASGRYYDNDAGQFGKMPHDAADLQKCGRLVDWIEAGLQVWQRG